MPFVKSTDKTSASKRRNVLDNGQSKKPRKARVDHPIVPDRRSLAKYRAVKPAYQNWVPDPAKIEAWARTLPECKTTALWVAYADHYKFSD